MIIAATIRPRGAPRDVRREGYKGLLHRGLYTIVFTTRYVKTLSNNIHYPTSTRRHGNFAAVHTLLRILLSSNSAVLINIITGVSPPHFDFVVYYVLSQC
jgi:hypothetical protein